MNPPCELSTLKDVANGPFGKSSTFFFCVVAECQPLFSTVSGKYFQNLTLVCTTQENPAIEMTVFIAKRRDAFSVKRLGDVALVKTVKVKEYDEERNLKLRLNTRESGVAFFDLYAADAEPYLVRGDVPEVGSLLVQALELEREFGKLWLNKELDFWISKREVRLDGVQPGEIVDVGCKVVAADINCDPKLLWVWDGSDVAPETMRGDDVLDNSFGRSFEENCSFVRGPWSATTQAELEAIPTVGSIIPVVIVGGMRWMSLPTGWVKLRKLMVMRFRKQLLLLFTDSSRWSPVPGIFSIQETYNRRLSERHEFVLHQPQEVISMVQRHPVSPVTLRNVNGFMHRMTTSPSGQEEETRQEFRCLAYAMECEPTPEEIAEMAVNADLTLTAELLLQDATDKVWATLHGRHAERFFGASQIDNDEERRQQADHIRSSLARAVMENEPVPWFDVCLRVIFKGGVSAVQVVDTVLV